MKPQNKVFTLFVDGASRGNPGDASIGCTIVDPNGEEVFTVSERIGIATNNVAEYTALLQGLKKALKEKISHIEVKADSELMVKQMKGEYKVKNLTLKELFTQTQSLSKKFDSFSIKHVRREQNERADELANLALDQ
jgi:ribonuclease HI